MESRVTRSGSRKPKEDGGRRKANVIRYIVKSLNRWSGEDGGRWTTAETQLLPFPPKAMFRLLLRENWRQFENALLINRPDPLGHSLAEVFGKAKTP